MLSISSDAEELAHRIARKTGKSPEDVIRDSLDATARALGVADDDVPDTNAQVAAAEAIVRQYRSLPLLDNRSSDEILGYDERGLPT